MTPKERIELRNKLRAKREALRMKDFKEDWKTSSERQDFVQEITELEEKLGINNNN